MWGGGILICQITRQCGGGGWGGPAEPLSYLSWDLTCRTQSGLEVMADEAAVLEAIAFGDANAVESVRGKLASLGT